MKKAYCFIICFFILLFIPGCWDEDLLKNGRLIFGIGYDYTPEKKILATYVIRDAPVAEQLGPRNDLLFVVGDTPREARDKADSRVSYFIRTYKNQVVLIGEERAKQDIYPLLDVLYRDPKSALNAKIAVAQGKASEIFAKKKVGNILIEQEISNLIKSSEESTLVPKMNIQTICPVLVDFGEDVVLPYIKKNRNRVEASQIALFHQKKFTGVLNTHESLMYLLLKGEQGKTARISTNIGSKKDVIGYDHITIEVAKSKPKLKVIVQSNDQIRVKLTAKWKVNVVEYPKDDLDKKETVERLNQILSKQMTLLSKQTLKKMQDAQCDGFGIGRQLVAFHPEIWKKKKDDWGYHYQKEVQFDTKVQVKIMNSGIIN